ncbi:uncharacterized protein [Littorina saxatilis]|uniref:uncharacterized protein isoform X2 n=1 Tax=Littorina saxatilis TaxID=31220 RepID=UPI0038B4D522
MEAEIVKSRRGLNLIFNDYVYRRDQVNGDFQFWRCTISACPGRLKADLSDPPNVIKVINHSHQQDEKEAKARVVKAELCTRVSANPRLPIPQVYRELKAEQEMAGEDTEMFPTFESCKSAMHRVRRSGIERQSVYIDIDTAEENVPEASVAMEMHQVGGESTAAETDDQQESCLQDDEEDENSPIDEEEDEMNEMDKMEAVIVKSRHGMNLIFTDYVYRRHKVNGNFQHWKCTNSACRGRLKSDLLDPPTVMSVTAHSHMPDEEEVKAKVVKAELCARARAAPGTPVSQVYNAFLTEQEVAGADIEVFPSFESCRSLMHRARKDGREQPRVYIDIDTVEENVAEASVAVEMHQGGSESTSTDMKDQLENSLQHDEEDKNSLEDDEEDDMNELDRMEAEIVKSRRGMNLIFTDYVYRRDKVNGDFQHWKCTSSGCRGRLKSDFSDPPVVLKVTTHSHLPDEVEAKAIVVKAELCARARADPVTPVSQVYKDLMTEQEMAGEDIEIFPSFESCRSTMHRARKSGTERVYTAEENVAEASVATEKHQGGSESTATETGGQQGSSLQDEEEDEMNEVDTGEAELVRYGQGVSLIYANHIYKGDRAYDQYQNWRCKNRRCPGRVKTDLGIPPTVLRAKQHNHPPDREKAKARFIKAELCARAQDNPHIPVLQIYNAFTSEQGAEVGEMGPIPSFSSCRSMMHRSRKKGAGQEMSCDFYSTVQDHVEQNPVSVRTETDQIVKARNLASQIVRQLEDTTDDAEAQPKMENNEWSLEQEQEKEKAERLIRLQQYRQGTWELNFDLGSFERWRQIGLAQGLGSDTDIACFLMLHYEKTKNQSEAHNSDVCTCRRCGTKLTHSCHKCESVTRDVSYAQPQENTGKTVKTREDAGNEMLMTLQDYWNEGEAQVKHHNPGEKDEQQGELSCSVCSATFTRATSLKVHMRKHTGERPYICNTCGAMFSHASSLSVHKRSHTGVKPYVCEQCGAAFSVGSVLKQHMRKHSGEKPFRCKLCPASFTQSTKLTIHMRRHTGVRPYQCEHCGAAFTSSHALNIHLRSHSGDKPYVCQDCGKGFSQSAHLTVHSRIHTGDRPFKCKDCDAAFLDSTHLRRHVQTHTAEKSHQCQECGASFSTAFALRRHSWSHTVYEKPYKCDGCLRTFTTNFCLKRHTEKGRCTPREDVARLQILPDDQLEIASTVHFVSSSGDSSFEPSCSAALTQL